MTTIGHSAKGLRARITSLARQMDWMRGLRAAVALCTPLVVGDLTGLQNLGWAALGGFEAILADQGGPYRTRLTSLATLSLGGAAGLFLGAIAGRSLYWALPVTVAFCFLWSYLAVFGQPFLSAGLLVQVIYICGIGAPAARWPEALEWSIYLLAGGAWAAMLSLLLWPIDAYRPARTAVADCYRELASFIGSVAELAAAKQTAGQKPAPALWHRLAKHHQYRIRRAIERGWQAVASVRAEHYADSSRERQLVVMLEHADLLIARTIALAEHLELHATADPSSCFERGLSGLDELRAAELWIASFLVSRRGQSLATAQARCADMDQLPRTLENCLDTSNANNRFMLAQVTESASLLEGAIESAAQLRFGKPPAAIKVNPVHSAGHAAYVYERLGQHRRGLDFDLFAANLTRRSLILRHAARVAIVCGLDVAIILWLHIDHGYWLLLTSLIVLQPYVSGTLRRGLERVAGTVGGGILAAILALILHSQLATAAVLFPITLLALAILPLSYAAFAFFLTPAFVLAWLPYSGDWQLALVRTMNTFAGGIMSVLAMIFLFPVYERERTPEYLCASLDANRRYLVQLAEAWKSRSRSSRVLANARRAAGLAHNDTEESLERMMAESWPRRPSFAKFAAAFVTYLRRFAQSVTTLTTLHEDWAWKQSAAVQGRLELLNRRMAWLEDETSGRRSSSAWPDPAVLEIQPPVPGLDHPGERQLERLVRQTEILQRQLNSLRDQGWLQKNAEASKSRSEDTGIS